MNEGKHIILTALNVRKGVKQCLNGGGAFHEKGNNEVSGEWRGLTQLKTSKDQSNICRSGAARYCATVFRNNLTAILFCTTCECRSQVKGCILRYNFTTQLQHIWRVLQLLSWKHGGCFHFSYTAICSVLFPVLPTSFHNNASPFPLLQLFGAFRQTSKWKLGSEWANTTVFSQHTQLLRLFEWRYIRNNQTPTRFLMICITLPTNWFGYKQG